MNTREQLEYAAKAYWGDAIDDVVSIEWSELDNAILYTDADNQDHNGQDVAYCWNPLTDQADSDRMACRLRISIEFDTDCVFAWTGIGQFISDSAHNNTDEDVCRAVREARLAVAVEIGRMK
jgi:hypothetical protein